jgi:hypothetical protein
VNLLLPSPPLQLFLAPNGNVNVSKDLVPNQAVDIVSGGEAFQFMLLMLTDAPLNVVGDTNIEGMRSAGHDVDRVPVFSHTTILLPVGRRVCVAGHRAMEPQIPPAAPAL